jgi:hypothetical protein
VNLPNNRKSENYVLPADVYKKEKVETSATNLPEASTMDANRGKKPQIRNDMAEV